MARYSKKASAEVAGAMRELERGTLKSGRGGEKVPPTIKKRDSGRTKAK